MTNDPNQSSAPGASVPSGRPSDGSGKIASVQGENRREEHAAGGTAREPGENPRSGRQQVELPEHQGVITDYVPPRGGMQTEVGDIDAEAAVDGIESPDAGDEPLPGHMGGGLAGG